MTLLTTIFFFGLLAIGFLLFITGKLQDRAKWRQTVRVNRIVTVLVIAEFILALVLLYLYGSMI